MSLCLAEMVFFCSVWSPAVVKALWKHVPLTGPLPVAAAWGLEAGNWPDSYVNGVFVILLIRNFPLKESFVAASSLSPLPITLPSLFQNLILGVLFLFVGFWSQCFSFRTRFFNGRMTLWMVYH